MYTNIVWVVEFEVRGQLDSEQFSNEEYARKWAKGPWIEGGKAVSIHCEIHTVTAGPKEVLQ